MTTTNISSNIPVEPYIELDGGYARCAKCWNEIAPNDSVCPHCKQAQDWSWLKKRGNWKYE